MDKVEAIYELLSALQKLSKRLNRSFESLFAEALKEFISKRSAKQDIEDICRLQFKTPFRIP